MRILIAEDDPVSRRLLQATLTNWGYATIVCRDGGDALMNLESDTPPEIAILDWMMPELDGTEVCRRIREKPVLVNVYIMLLTTRAEHSDIIAGLQAGADDYVTKPFHQQELFARIQVGIRISGLRRKMSERVLDLENSLRHLHTVKQSQEIEAMGRLASDVASKIHSPIQYVGDNLRFLQTSWPEIQKHLPSGASDGKLDHMIEKIPLVIDQSLDNVVRINKAVQSMRDFAQPAESDPGAVLNRAIETSVTTSAPSIQTNPVTRIPLVEPLMEPGTKGDGASDRIGRSEPNAPSSASGEQAFDLQELLERVEGDKDLLQDLLRLFREQSPRLLAEMRRCASSNDAEGLQRAAHSFRGACANLSARPAMREASVLEGMGQEANLGGVNEQLAAIEREASLLEQALIVVIEEPLS